MTWKASPLEAGEPLHYHNSQTNFKLLKVVVLLAQCSV